MSNKKYFWFLKGIGRRDHITLRFLKNYTKTNLELTIEQLNADEGLATLIEKLDSLFPKDENQRTNVAYEEFESYSRPTEMSIDNYISDFERLYNKVKAYKI